MRKVRTAALGLIVIAAIAYPAIIRLNGYCSASGKFTTEDDLIKAAANFKIVFNNSLADSTTDKTIERYNGYEDFIRSNPDCCAVSGRFPGEGPPYEISFLQRAFGISYVWVAVDWKMNMIHPDGRRETTTEQTYIILDQCGNNVAS